MRKLLHRFFVAILCCLLLVSPRPAHADSLHTAVVEVIVGIVAVTAAVTVGVVLLVRHHPSVKGCAVSGPDGLQLTNGDGQTFLLVGDLDGLKPGERVRVSGKKAKGSAPPGKFVVEKSQVYGPCPATATP